MTLTAGTLSQVSVGPTTASLLATAATGGTGPYTYQWHKSTSANFVPGVGNIISGATSLALNDTGLIPGTMYYYNLVATDTGHSNDTVNYTELAVTTTAPELSQNQFGLSSYLGVVDQSYNYNTSSVQIDSTQATPLYTGAAVKMYDRAGGSPKVVGCTANSDNVLGFINFDIKSRSYSAGSNAQISKAGNVIYLYATGAIARGAQVSLDLTTNGGVRSAAGNTGDRIVGWAYDKADAAGQLIRVFLTTPSFQVV